MHRAWIQARGEEKQRELEPWICGDLLGGAVCCHLCQALVSCARFRVWQREGKGTRKDTDHLLSNTLSLETERIYLN